MELPLNLEKDGLNGASLSAWLTFKCIIIIAVLFGCKFYGPISIENVFWYGRCMVIAILIFTPMVKVISSIIVNSVQVITRIIKSRS